MQRPVRAGIERVHRPARRRRWQCGDDGRDHGGTVVVVGGDRRRSRSRRHGLPRPPGGDDDDVDVADRDADRSVRRGRGGVRRRRLRDQVLHPGECGLCFADDFFRCGRTDGWTDGQRRIFSTALMMLCDDVFSLPPTISHDTTCAVVFTTPFPPPLLPSPQASEGPCPCPEGMTRCPAYDWGTYATGGFCQRACCDDGPDGTEVACPASDGSTWQIPLITYCAPVSEVFFSSFAPSCVCD